MSPFSLIGSAAKGVAFGAGGALAAASQAGPLGLAKQAFSSGMPYALPDPLQIIAAWQRGMINPDPRTAWFQTKKALSGHGINFTGETDGLKTSLGKVYGGVWQGVARLNWVYPQVETIIDAYVRGHLGQFGQFDKSRTSEFSKHLQRSGGYQDIAWPYLPLAFSWLGVPSLNEARNRDFIGDKDYETGLDRLAIRDPIQREAIKKMRQILPTLSDLVTMEVREAFQPVLAGARGQYNETPVNFQRWAAAQGLYGGPGFMIVSDGIEREATWADLYWAAHWQPIAPTQAYVMYWRLREDQLHRYQHIDPAIKPYTIDNLKFHLRIADYPQAERSWLAAIAHNPLRLFDIRNGFLLRLRDRKWVYDRMLDRGLAPEDAQFDAELLERQRDLHDRPYVRTTVLGCKRHDVELILYEGGHGIISPEVAQNALIEEGFSLEQSATCLRSSADSTRFDRYKRNERLTLSLEDQSRKALVRQMLVNYEQGIASDSDADNVFSSVNLDHQSRERFIETVRLKRRSQCAQSIQHVVQRRFQSGEWSVKESEGFLISQGISPERAVELVQCWAPALVGKRRMLTTADVKRLVGEGYLSVQAGAARLRNLGWSNPDSLLLVSEAEATLRKLETKALAARSRSQNQQARAAMSALRQLSSLQRRLVSDLRREAPPSRLQMWASKGIITEEEFRDRMKLLGFHPPEISHYWSEVESKMNGRARRRQAKGPKVVTVPPSEPAAVKS